jgi:hypothetical protein
MAIICSVVFLMMTVGGIGVVANPDEETDFEKLGGPCRIVEIRTRAQWSTGSGCHTGYTYRFCDPDETSCTHLSVLEQHLVCDGSCGACTSRTIVPSLENNTAVDCWRKKSNTNPPDNLCGSPRCYKVFTPPGDASARSWNPRPLVATSLPFELRLCLVRAPSQTHQTGRVPALRCAYAPAWTHASAELGATAHCHASAHHSPCANPTIMSSWHIPQWNAIICDTPPRHPVAPHRRLS